MVSEEVLQLVAITAVTAAAIRGKKGNLMRTKSLGDGKARNEKRTERGKQLASQSADGKEKDPPNPPSRAENPRNPPRNKAGRAPASIDKIPFFRQKSRKMSLSEGRWDRILTP
jgi:hypothetical protein